MLAAEYFAFGSGPDEVAVNLEDARRHTERDFAQAEAISVQFGEPMIGSTGDTAWFACDCTFLVTIAGQAHRYDGRMSGVLRKSGDRWLIAMNHFAIPPSGQEAGKSYPDAK